VIVVDALQLRDASVLAADRNKRKAAFERAAGGAPTAAVRLYCTCRRESHGGGAAESKDSK